MQEHLRKQTNELLQYEELSQSFFARTLNMDRTTFRNWLNGTSYLNDSSANKLKSLIELFTIL